MTQLRRILGVDDNRRNLAILERALSREVELVTATSGMEALEIAPRFRPDVILLDIMMPGMNGYEVCRQVRKLPELSGTKIILVSAMALASDRLEGYAAGADDYITKPFDHEELLAKLRVYLRLRSLEEVDRLKSDLLCLLSHETRTPLTTILGPAELLMDDSTLTMQQRDLARIIHRGGVSLLTMIDKVTFLSRLKAGLAIPAMEAIDARSMATRAIARAQVAAERADVRVDLEMEDSIQVVGDAAQLELVLTAILDNALRVSPAEGVVGVAAIAAEDWIHFSISDQGPGIGPDLIGRVFDEFVSDDITHHARGHGLSMATARIIVEQHRGRLMVESETAHGATFQMQLPARAVPALAA